MRNQLASAMLIVLVVAGIGSLTPNWVSGQTQEPAEETWTVGRTVDGQPDLQGIWSNNNATPLERPEVLGEREYLTEKEVALMQERADQIFANSSGDASFGDEVFQALLTDQADFSSSDTATGNYNQFWVVERDFDNRTSLVTDPPNGRLPSLTPEAEERIATRKIVQERAYGPEDRSLGDRCITFSVPSLVAGYNSYYQILQVPGYVVLLMEMIHDVRIIPLDGRPHIGNRIRQWHGDSRAHWEGDTLVIDTTNYSPKSYFKGSQDNLHVTERFTRVGPNSINYEFTVEDQATWTDSWTAMIPLKKTDDTIFEYACHEGNYGMEGILAGARALEKAPQGGQ